MTDLIKIMHLFDIKKDDAQFVKTMKKIRLNKEFYKYEQIAKLENTDIGMMIPKHTILVDIDSREQSDLLVSILKIEKIYINVLHIETKRGAHFYFASKNNEIKQVVDTPSAIGINVDTRVPGKGYGILPNSKNGRIIKNFPKQLADIPAWLIPNKGLKYFFEQNRPPFVEGSRDNNLFWYINELVENTELERKDALQTVVLFNEWQIKPSLPQNVILEKLDRVSFKKRKKKEINLIEIAEEYLAITKLIYYNDQLYYFDNGIYIVLTKNEIERNLIELNEKLKINQRREIIEFIKLKCKKADNFPHDFQIFTPNQIIDVKTGQIVECDPNIFNTTQIKYDYNEYAKTSKIDKYMLSTFRNLENVEAVYEFIGYTFMYGIKFRSAYILFGDSQSGKSTFLEIIRRLFHVDSVCNLDIAVVEKDPRLAIKFADNLINIADDISSKQLTDGSIAKKLISGDIFEIDRKHMSSVSFRPRATPIFTANKKPNFKLIAPEIISRFILFKFKRPKKIDPFLIDKFNDSDLEYLTFKSIEAIKRAVEKGELTQTNDMLEEKEIWIDEQSSVILFVKSEFKNKVPQRVPQVWFYQKYTEFCIKNGINQMGKNDFNDTICSNYYKSLRQSTSAFDDNGNVMRFL